MPEPTTIRKLPLSLAAASLLFAKLDLTNGPFTAPVTWEVNDGVNVHGIENGTWDLTAYGYGKIPTAEFLSNGALGNGLAVFESSLIVGDKYTSYFGQALGFLNESTLGTLLFTPDWVNSRINVTNLNVAGSFTANIVIGDSATTNATLSFVNTATSGTLKFKATDQTFEFDYKLLLPNKGLWFAEHSLSPWDRGDKISLFANRFDVAGSYVIGVDSNTLYMRSPQIFDWQINELNTETDKVSSMRLTAAGLTIGRGLAGVDPMLTLHGETNDFVMTWMEDEDYLKVADDVVFDKDVSITGTATLSDVSLTGDLSGTENIINLTRDSFGAVYRHTISPDAYTDYTAEAKSTLGTSFTPLPTNNFDLYVGNATVFPVMYADIYVGQVGQTTAYDYSTGQGTWATLTVTDGTSNWTVDGNISWTPPVNWAQATYNGFTGYWVRVSSSTSSSTDVAVYSLSPRTNNNVFSVWGNAGDTNPAIGVNANGQAFFGNKINGSISLTGGVIADNLLTSYYYFYNTRVLAAATDIGIHLLELSAASGTVPARYSPAEVKGARAWTGAASNTVNFRSFVVPTSAATPTGELRWEYDLNGGGYATRLSLFSNGDLTLTGNLTMPDAKDIVLNTTTGTKIGTATTQKLSLWNATPIVQPTTAVGAATLTGGGGTTLTDTDTFDGYTLKQVVKALRNIGILA